MVVVVVISHLSLSLNIYHRILYTMTPRTVAKRQLPTKRSLSIRCRTNFTFTESSLKSSSKGYTVILGQQGVKLSQCLV